MTYAIGGRVLVTQERLKGLLSYDPNTGVFKWRLDRFAGKNHNRATVKAGDVAGSITRYGNVHYLQIRINGRSYFGHRLAWFYENGVWPKMLDHRDGIGTHNAIANLRECTKSQNAMNTAVLANNTSGCRGVSWDKSSKGWAVYISHKRKRTYLGNYRDFEEAKRVRRKAEQEIHGEWARAS